MTSLAPVATVEPADAQLAAAGDAAAFGRLVTRHHAEMARVAYVVTGDAALAEDAVQSAWLACWARLPSLRDPLRVRPWLFAIVLNEARQIMRRRRRVAMVELDLNAGATTSTADPAVGIGRLDLVRALAHLAPDDRALLALRYVAGLDAVELGAVTGRSASGTRARLSRLTARLRRELHDA